MENLALFVDSVIARYKTISERIEVLSQAGIVVHHGPMGSGGCGQVKNGKKQISHGSGRYNYAYYVNL
jgi:hypothetical protein